MALLSSVLGAACAGIKSGTSGSGGGGGMAIGTGGSGGQGPAGSSGGDVGTGAGGAACQMYEMNFVPRTPTVYVLVDRSGSEFASSTTGTYFTLRAATLQVIQMLQAEIRFGLGVFHGDHSTGTCEPDLEQVPIALNNYDAINTTYSMLGQPAGKVDTPCFAVMPMVKAALVADQAVDNGPKYVLFVTDSETDFCDDGEAVCPADAVTWAIQDLYATTPSIGTLVIGLPTSLNSISPTVLQNFANAGAGQPVVVPQPNAGMTFTGMNIYNDCFNGSQPYKAAWTALGKPALSPMATYGTTAGTATVFTPTAVSQQALADQISAALATVKSCTFDLAGHILVDTSQLNKAAVLIDGVNIPLSTTNGWTMTSPTQLELVGSACDTWRSMSAMQIVFNFPCEIITPG